MLRLSFGFLLSVIIGLFIVTESTGLVLADPLPICGNDSKPPKIYNDKEGNPKGILIDMLNFIEKEMKASFKITLTPWKRCYYDSLLGKSAVVGLSINTERLKLIDYSDVLYYDEILLVVKRGKEFKFETIDDLRGKRIGVTMGGSYGENYERGKNSIFTAIETSIPILRYRMLLRDRMDAFLIGPGRAGFMALIKTDMEMFALRDQFTILPTPFNSDSNHLGILKHPDNKIFLERFNSAIRIGKESGAFEKIIKSYE